MTTAECPYCHHINDVDTSDIQEGEEKLKECDRCEVEFTVFMEDGYLQVLDPETVEISEDPFYESALEN